MGKTDDARRSAARTVRNLLLKPWAFALRDLLRFLDRHYLAAKTADFLHRSLRRRMSQVALAVAAGILGANLTQTTVTGPGAALAAVIGLFAWCLQVWATKALEAKLAYARSHGVFLLKDRRKTELLKDLPRIWRRVYAPEIPQRFPDPNQRRQLRKTLKKMERNSLGQTWESRRFDFGLTLSHARSGLSLLSARAFRAAVEYELMTSHPQSTQDARLGFSLALLEDALDGAVTGGDLESLPQRLSAHPFTTRAERALRTHDRGLLFYLQPLMDTLHRHVQAFWRRNAWLALEARTGALLKRLHDRYDNLHVDAQDLLWQDDEALLSLALSMPKDTEDETSIADVIRRETAREARRVFSREKVSALRIVTRMYGHDLVRATLLLAASDPEYALACGSGVPAGSPRTGACDPLEDLKDAGAPASAERRLRRIHQHARKAHRKPSPCPDDAKPNEFRTGSVALHEGNDNTAEQLRFLRLKRELASWEMAYAKAHVLRLCHFESNERKKAVCRTTRRQGRRTDFQNLTAHQEDHVLFPPHGKPIRPHREFPTAPRSGRGQALPRPRQEP